MAPRWVTRVRCRAEVRPSAEGAGGQRGPAHQHLVLGINPQTGAPGSSCTEPDRHPQTVEDSSRCGTTDLHPQTGQTCPNRGKPEPSHRLLLHQEVRAAPELTTRVNSPLRAPIRVNVGQSHSSILNLFLYYGESILCLVKYISLFILNTQRFDRTFTWSFPTWHLGRSPGTQAALEFAQCWRWMMRRSEIRRCRLRPGFCVR